MYKLFMHVHFSQIFNAQKLTNFPEILQRSIIASPVVNDVAVENKRQCVKQLVDRILGLMDRENHRSTTDAQAKRKQSELL